MSNHYLDLAGKAQDIYFHMILKVTLLRLQLYLQNWFYKMIILHQNDKFHMSEFQTWKEFTVG